MNNNQVTLVGHVGQSPKSKSFEDTGNQLVKFSIAVTEYSAKTDERKTLWFEVDSWNGLGERVLKNVTKGREVVIHGRLSLSFYSKDVNGAKVQVTKPVIKLTNFYLCGKKPTPEDVAEPG